MGPNPQETVDLVTFTEDILNGKLHFLCSVSIIKCPFSKPKRNEMPSTGEVITNPSLATNKNQAAVDNTYTEDIVTRAEIRWSLKTVGSKFLLCS